MNIRKDGSAPPSGTKVGAEALDLLFTLQGKDRVKVFTLNTENVCRILRHHPDFEGRFRFDSFTNLMETRYSAGGKWRPLEDADAIRVQVRISILFSFFQRVTKQMCMDAVMHVSKESAIDSALDYVTSLAWDGTARLDTWLAPVYGCPDDAYHRAVASNWMKALVSRIVRPGCKFDQVLVIEGAQDAQKSMSLDVLGNGWHIETTMNTETKDFFMQMQGKAIVEFSEGATNSKTDVKRMKAIITTRVDTFRAPYDRIARDYPRRCVFAMTTNEDEYLKDDTGNRRWLPIRVTLPKVNVQWIADNRDQLYAEAYERAITNGEPYWVYPKEETAAEQFKRRVLDPNADLVCEWYDNLTESAKSEGITVHMAFRDVFGMGFSSRPMSKFEEMSITGILKDSLDLVKRRGGRGDRSTRWFPPGTDHSPLSRYAAELHREKVDDPMDF